MKAIGKMTVLSLVVSSVLFGATATTNVDVQTLAREISQTSDPVQRAEMMNDIKSSLANMNEAQREDALKGIRDGMEREHENSQSDMSSRGQGKEKQGSNNKEGSSTENSDNSSHNGSHDNQNAGNGGDHGGGDAGDSGGGNSGAGDAGNGGAGDAGNGGDHGGGDAGDSNGGNHD